MTGRQVFADWTTPLAREFFAPNTFQRGQFLAVAVGAGLPAATSITCKPPPNHTMFAIDREFDKANS